MTARTQASFNRDSAEEAAIKNTDNIAGSLVKEDITTTIYNFETKRLEPNTFIHVPAMDRVGYELIVNAGDNVVYTRMMCNMHPNGNHKSDDEWTNPDVGCINIKMTNEELIIESYGLPMPVEPHLKESTPDRVMLVPELAFGHMNAGTSGNKSEYSITSGKNGIGGKIANILGKNFVLEVGDPINRQCYKGVWRNRMRELVSSESYPGYTFDNSSNSWINNVNLGHNSYDGPSYFRTTYNPTNEYDWTNYSDNNIMHFAKVAIELSLSTRVVINFKCRLSNGIEYDEKFDCHNVEEFLKYTQIPPNIQSQHFYLWRNDVKNVGLDDRRSQIVKSKIDIQEKVSNSPQCVMDFPELEYHIYDTPNSGMMYAMTNGMPNIQGGIHVNCLISKLVKLMMSRFKISKLSVSTILKHVTVVVMARVNNPTFDAQTKTSLIGWNLHNTSSRLKKTFTLSDDVDFFTSWDACTLIRDLDAAQMSVVTKVSKKNNKNIEQDKLSDANWAGTKDSSNRCQLSIVEGESAESFASRRICALPNGRNLGGTYQLRGKTLNTVKSSEDKVQNNATLNGIKKALGLDVLSNDGRGYDFTTEEHRNLLRYHSVILLTDGDLDGYHIRCLVISFFHWLNPTLIDCGFLSYLEVPILKIYKKSSHKPGKKRESPEIIFTAFTELAALEWSKANSHMKNKVTISYFKGLGSFNDADNILDECGKLVTCILDEESKGFLNIAFEGIDSNTKKEWINCFRDSDTLEVTTQFLAAVEHMRNIYTLPNVCNDYKSKLKSVLGSIECDITSNLIIGKPDMKKGKKSSKLIANTEDLCASADNYALRSISNVLNVDLISYIVASIIRAIPCFLDGNKKVHRQAMSHMLDYYKYGLSQSEPKKVCVLSTEACTRVSYKHGPDSMTMTIVLLAQSITGVKNLSALTRDGSFGNREHGGKNVSTSTGRYAKTRAEWWVSYAYNKDIVDLIPRIESEGETCEELFIPSDIPFHLINGCDGVGSGYSSKIPLHNPWDCVDWLIERCENGSCDRIITPWFNGFTGECDIINYDSTIRECIKTMPLSVTERENGKATNHQNGLWKEFINKKTGQTLVTYGKFTISNNTDGTTDVHITELPIGICPAVYIKRWKSKINVKVDGVYSLKDIDNNGTTDNVNIKLMDVNPEVVGLNFIGLGLTTKFTMSNMNLCDLDGYVVHFNNSGEILETHFRVMNIMYNKMKIAKLKKLGEDRHKIDVRYRILCMFKDGTMSVSKDDEWDNIMIQHGIEPKAINGITLVELKKGDVDKLREKIKVLDETIEELSKLSSVELYKRRLVDFKNNVLKVLKYPRNNGNVIISSYMHDDSDHKCDHIEEINVPTETELHEATTKLWREIGNKEQ